jgi:putative redox protein
MAQEQTGGTGTGDRSVSMTRLEKGLYEFSNVRGGTMRVGGGGDTPDFTPVELLLVAIAGCSGTDVDFITSKRAEPLSFSVTAQGEKIRDEQGNNRMRDLTVRFSVTFPEGEAGDRAREMLPRAIQMSEERLCTVSRTVALGTPIDAGVEGDG